MFASFCDLTPRIESGNVYRPMRSGFLFECLEESGKREREMSIQSLGSVFGIARDTRSCTNDLKVAFPVAFCGGTGDDSQQIA